MTGAGHGLGRAITIALARAGARVVLVGRSPDSLEETAGLVRGTRVGVDARAAVADVTDPDAVAALAEELADEDVSVLVNNAGAAGPVKPLVEVEPAEWDDVFAVNVRGMYLMCRAFLSPMLAAGRGDVVNLASVTGKRPLAGRTPYAASKMAVLGLTASLAAEVGPQGVSVNSLSPGPVDGPRYAEEERAFASTSALDRMVTEEEVGKAVVAMLDMPGLSAADIDLSAGLFAR